MGGDAVLRVADMHTQLHTFIVEPFSPHAAREGAHVCMHDWKHELRPETHAQSITCRFKTIAMAHSCISIMKVR